jgi:hypothetical protein
LAGHIPSAGIGINPGCFHQHRRREQTKEARMSADGASAIPSAGYEASAIRQLMQENQRRMKLEMNQRDGISNEMQTEVMRRQIESIGFYSDRAMATEMTNRDMSSLFSSFTLIARIMQGMG